MATRRSLLRQLFVVSVGVPLAAACGGSAPPVAGTSAPPTSVSAPPPTPTAPVRAASASGLPSYVPVQGPAPDLPPTADGVDPGYLNFPRTLFKSVAQTPGQGGEVNVFTWLITQPPTALDQNPAWQAVNTQLGVTMNVQMVPFADLNPKFSTLMASGSLPDLFLVPLLNTVQHLPEFLKTQCADLTPYLSGDAVRDYPNLANIPTLSWRNVIFNNAIYGVPIPISAVNTALFIHQTRWDAVGASAPQNGDDFKKILLELTNAANGQWGVGSAGPPAANSRSFFQGIFGAPNNWSVDGSGKLTKDYETDQSRAAVGYLRDLVSAGVWFPDSGNLNLVSGQPGFVGGQYAAWYSGWPNYPTMWDQAQALNPPARIHALAPFGAAGNHGVHYPGGAYYGFTAFKNATPDRVKELLRMVDFLAAPFGSQESLLLEYGVQGTDFTFDANGTPVLTDQGKNDVLVPWNAIGERPPVLYKPNAPEFAQVAQMDEHALLPLGVADPTLGLYSETNQQLGANIGATLSAALSDIILSRRPLSDYDQLIQDWRANGGDEIRTELQQAYAAAQH